MPEPIETAPKDGTVVLTDCGFARFRNQRNWGSPIHNGWTECDPFGNIYECADNGAWLCNPKFWEPVPDWITNGPIQ